MVVLAERDGSAPPSDESCRAIAQFIEGALQGEDGATASSYKVLSLNTKTRSGTTTKLRNIRFNLSRALGMSASTALVITGAVTSQGPEQPKAIVAAILQSLLFIREMKTLVTVKLSRDEALVLLAMQHGDQVMYTIPEIVSSLSAIPYHQEDAVALSLHAASTAVDSLATMGCLGHIDEMWLIVEKVRI